MEDTHIRLARMPHAGIEKGGYYPYPPHMAVGATFKVTLLPGLSHFRQERTGDCSTLVPVKVKSPVS